MATNAWKEKFWTKNKVDTGKNKSGVYNAVNHQEFVSEDRDHSNHVPDIKQAQGDLKDQFKMWELDYEEISLQQGKISPLNFDEQIVHFKEALASLENTEDFQSIQ